MTLKSAIFFLYFIVFILSFTACKKQAEEEKKSLPSPSETLIRINNKEITYGEFHDTFKRLFLDGETTVEVREEELRDLKRALINQLVEEELILQEANRLKLAVSNEEISKEVGEIKKEYGGDTFESTIVNRYGSIDRWREEIKRRLLIKKVIDDVITSKLTVKEDEAKRYYKEHVEEYNMKEQIRARMIVVKTEDEANKVRERLLKGEDFAKVAKEVSLSPEGRTGGDLGFFGRGDMPKEFEDVVFSLQPNTVSDVVKTVYGYHIFRVEGKRDAKSLSYREVRNVIIEKLKREKSDAGFQMWMKELKQKTRIEVAEEML
jgi:peptidyl-prolyl cis-trans isomerase C